MLIVIRYPLIVIRYPLSVIVRFNKIPTRLAKSSRLTDNG